MKLNESQLREVIRETIVNIFESMDEKAVSKAQQRFFGMVHAVQKGELDSDEVGDSVNKAAKSMTKKDVKDFAKTKHKGLPNHVNEEQLSERNNRPFYDYAEEYMKKNGKKLPDDTIRNAAEKNDKRFHERNRLNKK